MSAAVCSAPIIVVHCGAVLPRGLFGIETLAPPSEARRDISTHNYVSFLRHENEPEPELKPKPTLSGCSSVCQATLSAVDPLNHSPTRLKRLAAFHFPDAILTGSSQAAEQQQQQQQQQRQQQRRQRQHGGNTHDKLLASQIKIADFVSSATSLLSCSSNSKLPGARATVAAAIPAIAAVLGSDYQHNVANNLAAPQRSL
ncbi:hypothetical protein AWZ03_004997 [Drosophila navojoa]|uniref:Uncharacterized protein n=1 Tax=Drosophila navojoa TaxID=7232 RepID=A0A484BIV1_DRONA|nr:hypothetical protein AWZ03_004997 [Drosophila navojoa]